ncbi:MAG TPA: glucose-6-phosphate dehydrogenase assembly protein OpcA [Solirubrobacteraceae bacterium]
MSEDVWSERDTTPDAIEAALRELLYKRHAANHALVPARVLNLVVVIDREWRGEVANRLERVGRYHASRTVLCAVQEGRDTLDAVAVVSYQEPAGDGLGVMYESVEIDLGPEQLEHLATIVDPVIASDLPTVLWCPHGHDEAVRALRGITDVLLLDSDDEAEIAPALARAHDHLNDAYVVDLAWLRTTPWRERIAASFDPPGRRAWLADLDGMAIRHRPSSEASALLLAGWLTSRLGWEPTPLEGVEGSYRRGTARKREAEVKLELEPADQDSPGLAGVTLSCHGHFSLSLDRGRGGLRALEQLDGVERNWQVLGASRGEGGILGEGVRQALLRDHTYAPALEAARRFVNGG